MAIAGSCRRVFVVVLVAAVAAGERECNATSPTSECHVGAEHEESTLLSVRHKTAVQGSTSSPRAILRKIRIKNKCNRPVYFLEANKHEIPGGGSALFDENSKVELAERLTLLFQKKANVISETASVLELNGAFRGRLGRWARWANLNFDNQLSYFLPMDVALCADDECKTLVCNDARAMCNFTVSDCKFSDGQASLRSSRDVNFYKGEDAFSLCLPSSPAQNRQNCVNDYARYVSDKCARYDSRRARWLKQPYSVGYKTQGWKQAIFTDGMTDESTNTGRAGCHMESCTGVTFECFEAPCVSQEKSMCISSGYTSVGLVGFGQSCSQLHQVDVAVMEVVACPGGAGGEAPHAAAASSCGGELSPTCKTDIQWAKTTGFYQHPTWYPGLTPESSDAEFQLVIHQNTGSCPKPCQTLTAQAEADQCGPPTSPQCKKDLEWAIHTGVTEHPDWYPGLTPSSSQDAFQRHIHKILHTCPLPCKETNDVILAKPAASPSVIKVQNNCPMDLKVVDGGGDTWTVKELTAGLLHAFEPACETSCQMYFVPASWMGTPGKYSMGSLQPLGFFEYTKLPDQSLSTDISYILGLGMPMTYQCAGEHQPLYGCTDGGYGGWQSFQDRIQKYCPGRVQMFSGSDVKYCESGQRYGGEVHQLPYGKKWNIAATLVKANATYPSRDVQKIAECQPWGPDTAASCAKMHRGTPGCTGEDVCDGRSLFYEGYDMRDVSHPGTWSFSGYSAFVHTLCGVHGGFAWSSNDQGSSWDASFHAMKYASNVGEGCQSPTITLCPAASSSFKESGGFTFPPPAAAAGP